MSSSRKRPSFSRRALLKIIAALPAISMLGFSARYASSDEFVEVKGWILKRSDLRPRGGR